MGSDAQANSRNSTRNVLNKHPSSGGSFAFASLRCHRLLATDLVNERIIAIHSASASMLMRPSSGQRAKEVDSLTLFLTRNCPLRGSKGQAAGWEKAGPLRQQSTDTGGKRLAGRKNAAPE